MKAINKTYLFIGLLMVVTFFVSNASLPTDIMEARNIVTAREMVSDGCWLVPTMNNELRLEKPPLPTWVAGAIEYVCPDSLSAQRIAAGVMGVMWTMFLFLFAKLISNRTDFALLTTVVFLTCYHVVVMGRMATWDIYCHAFMMGGIYFLMRGLLDPPERQWRWFPVAGLMMGLSFLSKGPVSFYALLLPVLISITAFSLPTARGKWKGIAVLVIVCLVVSSWWYVYLLLFQHQAVEIAIRKESMAWSGHNVRPWYYYWRFFSETGIWAVIMLAALAISYWKRTLADSRTYLFCVSWTLVTLLLLSLMPEKKIRYLLPIMAPCAMCVACLMTHFIDCKDRFSRVLYQVNGFLVAVVTLAIPVALIMLHWVSTPMAVFLTFAFLIVAFFVVRATVRRKPLQLVYAVAVIFMLLECSLLSQVSSLFGNPHEHSIHETRQMAVLQDVPFCHPAQDSVRIELVYEAHRKILPLNLADSAAVMRRLPFALVSGKPARQELPSNVCREVEMVIIDRYDDNKHPRWNRLYTPDFINYVTLIKKKPSHE